MQFRHQIFKNRPSNWRISLSLSLFTQLVSLFQNINYIDFENEAEIFIIMFFLCEASWCVNVKRIEKLCSPVEWKK